MLTLHAMTPQKRNYVLLEAALYEQECARKMPTGWPHRRKLKRGFNRACKEWARKVKP